MSSHVITPGPYRATKLWNEVTRLFRAGMPLRKHRQNFRHHSSCFTASAAVEWLHALLQSNSNFGPDVTRQQTTQLLKKFLKNHVIEDVKGRWGSEELEDNNTLYRFPPTSPLKPIPRSASGPGSIKKRPSFRDKEGFFRFKSNRKSDKETQENEDPALQAGGENQPAGDQQMPRREMTVEDEQEIWRDITLTHLQRILGVSSLDEVLEPRFVNPQNIIHNMTKVTKHGVVTLDDKANDLPHWVLNAMKSLASWPKYDSDGPSYPGFERDVFKNVSDYFYSLPQPLLTYELYELFINVLVFCGYVAAPATLQLGKRKKPDLRSGPPPAKTSFRSTECLLLSLIRQGGCDETESPMRDVLRSRVESLKAGDGQLGGSCASLSTAASTRLRVRSCSLETILDTSAPLAQQQLFLSNDSLATCARGDSSASSTLHSFTDLTPLTKAAPTPTVNAPESTARKRPTAVSLRSASAAQRFRSLRPRSVGSCLDIVEEAREEEVKETKLQVQGRANSCLNVNTEHHHSYLASHPPSLSSCPFSPSYLSAMARAEASHATGASSTLNLRTLHAAPSALLRRCLSSLDVSKPSRPVSLFKLPVCVPTSTSQPPQPKPEQSLPQPQCERVAIEALQLCTLLLPPTSRRKLQLLMRMMSRISQNVDMPRLHPAIGTRTLMIHTFSGCVLGSAEECDLDELLATRLVSFLMDHQHSILAVPQYLLSAISDRIHYLRSVQLPLEGVTSKAEGGEPVCAPMPMYAFCHQISGVEFEQQKVASSQQAMEELLEILLTDRSLGDKDRKKKLKQFQKQYPDIYSRRLPSSERENNKPKIKPPLLNIKKTKTFSIRN